MVLNTKSKSENVSPAPGAAVGVTTLDRLLVGAPAVVSRVQTDDEELARLQAMGVCEGRPIHVMRGGSRMIVCAAGTRIGLDRRLAGAVTVTLLPPNPL